jgi:hypothetical protein
MSYFIVKCKWIAGNNRNDYHETWIGFVPKFAIANNSAILVVAIMPHYFAGWHSISTD